MRPGRRGFLRALAALALVPKVAPALPGFTNGGVVNLGPGQAVILHGPEHVIVPLDALAAWRRFIPLKLEA